MARDNSIIGIDVGNSKVSVVVATLTETDTHITGVATVAHSGVRRGIVTDLEETVSAVSHALEDAERMAGATVHHGLIGISGQHVDSQEIRGVIAVSKPTGQIDATDVARVLEAAKTTALPQNRELIHLFPRHYLVDGHDDIRDPIGLTGIRLEVDALLVTAPTSAVRNLEKAVTQAGVQIDGLMFSPIAAAKAVTTKKQRESGVVVVDFGAGGTSLAVYEEGKLLRAACIPIGSVHITNDIAIGLRTNLDVAEMIKIKYGSCEPEKIRDSESINLATLDPGETERVARKHVAEIIEARVAEILHAVQEELKQINKDGLLPAGAVFTGGGSLLEGIPEMARHTLRLPAAVGYPVVPFSGMIDKIDSPLYATSVGLIVSALEDGITASGPGVNIKLGGVWRP
jgi:cell division protein FtsA